MKKLLLIRHAKATHEADFKDFERPLLDRGLHDAANMATRLKETGDIPQILISSPALRTLATANIFSQHLNLSQAQINMDIYEASEKILVNVINSLPNEHDFIGIVGHNPGISELLYYLAGQILEVPTCAVMLITFDTDNWAEVSFGTGHLVYYDYPKNN
ncbi:MAG: histidine phosphatase family protein [Mucilaginibacter sp.]